MYVELLDMLESIKQENPELENILKQFQINQAEYARAMLTILSSQTGPYNTYVTDKDISRKDNYPNPSEPNQTTSQLAITYPNSP